jgi:hypothetical protein
MSRTNKRGNIAVVGAGIFGICTALILDENGFSVDLFEKYDDILKGASTGNQLRSHRGYHYPRSPETIQSCQRSTPVFEKKFAEAIITRTENLYAVASQDSRVSPEEYLHILDDNSLPYNIVQPTFFAPGKVSLTVTVKEHLIDIQVLKRIFLERLQKSGVRVHLNSPVTDRILDEYDFVVVAAYTLINDFFSAHPECQSEYQFELCEKPVVRLPKEFRDISLVVVDGPFFCLDPLGDTGLHLAGNVEYAIHTRSVGKSPQIPEHIRPYLDRGIVTNFPETKVRYFIEAIREFIPSLDTIEHVGSLITVRTVLPNVDRTDERPTIVRKVHPKAATIFSGKIGSCVSAAEEILKMVEEHLTIGVPQKISRPLHRVHPRL